MAKSHIGTSGWAYTHWRGAFYPPKLPPAEFLSYHSQRFDTVEVNNSFYRLPSPEQFGKWGSATRDGFVFSVKASRYITHIRRLRDVGDSVKRLLDNAHVLGPKLGPILFQLPPRWVFSEERLAQFLPLLDRSHRYAMEFRDESWFAPRCLELLQRHNVAFCIYDYNERQSPKAVTADFVYVRLHGPGPRYKGLYNAKAIDGWAHQVAGWLTEGRDTYFYFDNDERAYATTNATELRDRVDRIKQNPPEGFRRVS